MASRIQRVALFAVSLVILSAGFASAGATSCLTGTAPEVGDDAAEVQAVLDLIDSACPCASYDGVTSGRKKGDYRACVKSQYTAEVTAGHLRKECTATIKKITGAATCGLDPAVGARPCISTSLSSGKVSCKVRAATKPDGTPKDKCVSSTKATAVECPVYTRCLEAADTNEDLLIAAPGDSGSCAIGGEITCQQLDPLPSGTCSVTAGGMARVFIGDVLAPGGVFRGGQVVVDSAGFIVQVGCAADCDDACQATATGATTITCPTGVISPGLINTHDHLTFTQNDPVVDTGERYEHRHDWRRGLHGHTQIVAPGSASGDQVSWGELRHLFAGATSTVGSGGQTGLLRNLDRVEEQEGLAQTPVDVDAFPLNDSSGTQLDGTCDYGSGVTPAVISGDDAYFPHVAEGIDGFAANEAICLGPLNPANDVTLDKTSFTNGIAFDAEELATMAARGTGLIWSPRSNISLYGDTAMVTAARRLGVKIALGTDWIVTGSMNLLRELRCAKSFDENNLHASLTDKDLWEMVTSNAASLAAVDDAIGSLEPGKVADIAIFDGEVHDAYSAVVDADASDVVLVARAGKPLYGDDSIVSAIPGIGSCDSLDVCSHAKKVCLVSEIGQSYATLAATNASIYPAFFCGDPTGEPTCHPSRTVSVSGSNTYTGFAGMGDTDGDGIENASDNCPNNFNPVRPMDGGVQSDVDADGVGDACDPCSLDANTTSCTTLDPDDLDGDGVANTMDNCLAIANGSQADADGDNKGDACDACPNDSNPGSAACPATIYEIKNGTVTVGSHVAVLNALVTGRSSAGFFLQVKETDSDYSGPAYSGIFVDDATNAVALGDRVTLTDSLVSNVGGQIRLTSPSVTVVSSLLEPPPAPQSVSAADVATGGLSATTLEGVIVTVSNVSVTDVAPTPGAGDTPPINEFVVAGTLRINDFFYLETPFPVLGQNYVSITGIVDLRSGDSKLEPRSAADLVDGAPILVSFSPTLSYADEGQTGAPTFPTALTVTLSGPVAGDTFVTIDSSDPTSLTVVGGGVTVTTGNDSAQVLVNGLQQSPSVTLTASLDSVMLGADVRVVGALETPTLISLTPSSGSMTAGSTIPLTVGLDIPAPVGGTVIGLALTPSDAGTIPPTVTVPAHQTSASFNYTDGMMYGGVQIDATLDAVTLSSMLTVTVDPGHIVLNEVDYDNIGTDTAEFVEIYNGTPSAVSLTGYSLRYVNGGTNAEYLTVDLSPAGTLMPGQYLVVGSTSVTSSLSGGVLTIDQGAVSNLIQNGAPDGIALVDGTTSTVVDALSYEGAMTMVTLTGIGTVSLVEGTVLPVSVADSNVMVVSLGRLPNGVDTNDAATDWTLNSASTPGIANVP